jgi:hypothetical protein
MTRGRYRIGDCGCVDLKPEHLNKLRKQYARIGKEFPEGKYICPHWKRLGPEVKFNSHNTGNIING